MLAANLDSASVPFNLTYIVRFAEGLTVLGLLFAGSALLTFGATALWRRHIAPALDRADQRIADAVDAMNAEAVQR